jgi:hypothetical protein
VGIQPLYDRLSIGIGRIKGMASLETIERLLEDKIAQDNEWQDKVDVHLTKLNGKTQTCYHAIFGATENDPCINTRITKLESTVSWLREKWWLLLIMMLGSAGTGGIISQVLEGIWKRGEISEISDSITRIFG